MPPVTNDLHRFDSTQIPAKALHGSLKDYKEPLGRDLFGRTDGFFAWQDLRRRSRLWPYSKSTDTAPTTRCMARNDAGDEIAGVNFASQDYLGLSSHPEIKDVATRTIAEYGVHSAGSAALLGNTRISLALEETISAFLGGHEIVLYPTGWSAGFGAVQGFIRPSDHVVMDVLTHSCLQEGARAATRNIHYHGHLNVAAARRRLQKIRQTDTQNAILVVTESLFSMHSVTPDLVALRQVCNEFNAFLLVDAAHDLGCIGEDGLGHLGSQQMIHQADIIVGSFSKTFASNGGFVAVPSRAAKEYLKYYSATQTFSNALSPLQAAVVQKAFEIVASQEGRRLRHALMSNILTMRSAMLAAGLEPLGDPSAIVPVRVGAEGQARIASQLLSEAGAIANLVEYPAVPRGHARFRVQVMATHSREDVGVLVTRMRSAMEAAASIYARSREDESSSCEASNSSLRAA